MTNAELVLVVDRAAFFGGRWPQGFHPLAGAAAAMGALSRIEWNRRPGRGTNVPVTP